MAAFLSDGLDDFVGLVLKRTADGLVCIRKRVARATEQESAFSENPSPTGPTCWYGHDFQEVFLDFPGWGWTKKCSRCDQCQAIKGPKRAR